jgi:hypothetical protein
MNRGFVFYSGAAPIYTISLHLILFENCDNSDGVVTAAAGVETGKSLSTEWPRH